MSIGLLIFLVILFVVALVATLMAFKEEEDKMKKHKDQGDTPKEDARRSEEYEKKWLETGLRTQVIIYSVALVLSIIIALVIFM